MRRVLGDRLLAEDVVGALRDDRLAHALQSVGAPRRRLGHGADAAERAAAEDGALDERERRDLRRCGAAAAADAIGAAAAPAAASAAASGAAGSTVCVLHRR